MVSCADSDSLQRSEEWRGSTSAAQAAVHTVGCLLGCSSVGCGMSPRKGVGREACLGTRRRRKAGAGSLFLGAPGRSKQEAWSLGSPKGAACQLRAPSFGDKSVGSADEWVLTVSAERLSVQEGSLSVLFSCGAICPSSPWSPLLARRVGKHLPREMPATWLPVVSSEVVMVAPHSLEASVHCECVLCVCKWLVSLYFRAGSCPM